MISNFLLFMVFSTIEGLSIYAISMYVYRIDLKKYIWYSLIIINIINLQNFFAREELAGSAAILAPIANLLITVLFLVTIVRIPLIWSAVMTITGYAAFMLIQTALVFGVFGNVQALSENPWNGYMLQLLTGGICLIASNVLYRLGYGFTFDFEKIALWKERYFVILIIIIFATAICWMMINGNLYINLLGFLACFLVFLCYSFKREEHHGI